MTKSIGVSIRRVSQNFELVVDWEEKLVPYLKSAGAQSVAVVSAHYLLVYQVNNLKKTGGNLLWVLPWCPYVSQVENKYLSFDQKQIFKN